MGALQSLQRCLARPLAERLGGSFVLEELSGGESLPTDKSWSGCIQYDPVGMRMSAVLSVMFEAGRRSHSFMPQRGAPTPQYFAYGGGYAVDEASGTVSHHIDVSIAPPGFPVPSGLHEARGFSLTHGDEVLLLSLAPGTLMRWRRVRPGSELPNHIEDDERAARAVSPPRVPASQPKNMGYVVARLGH